MQKHTIKFEGHTIAYDAHAIKAWSVQRGIAEAATNPAGAFKAYDAILLGKADEVAEKLGDDIEVMGKLVERIAAVVGDEAKN
jgi:hypothetical protein